jgi:outer membrane immunogenic protein
MRKIFILLAGLLTAQSALAADLPVKVAPYVAPQPVNIWDGFYVGIMGGYVWNNSTTSFAANDLVSQFALDNGIVPNALSTHTNGGFVGGTIGYNRQYYGSWVLGLELDAAWASAKQDNTFLFSEEIYYPKQIGGGLGSINVTTTTHNQLNWFGTMRGRIGYLVTPTTLLYGTGGIAVGQVEAQSTHSLSIGSYPIAAAVGTFNDTRAGWTAGVGLEQKFWDHWSLKAEYRHIDLGTANWSASTSIIGIIPVQFNAQTDLKYDMALVGLNYKW